MMRHGWFIIPGVQNGDRTLEEQLVAVRAALAGVAGKAVLDLGCAEGLIGREFARAGAASVLGVENLHSHIEVAQKQCAGLPMRFRQADMNLLAKEALGAAPWQDGFDVVLALGIIHKMHEPRDGVVFAARACRAGGLLLLRSGRGAVGNVIWSKHRKQNSVDAHAVLAEEGFKLEKIETGPANRQEDVEYWRKVA